MKCSFAWRGQLYFFTGLMFGLRHASLAAQQVTSAVTKAHREAGLNSQQSTVPVFQFGKIQFSSLLNLPILFRLKPHQFDINVSFIYFPFISLYIFPVSVML